MQGSDGTGRERIKKMLQKYIELEKLRYGNRLEVAFTVSGDTKGLEISPLLLLPFVENCFKHGVSEQLDQCWININVVVKDSKFTFQVSNSRLASNGNNFGGLGMENVMKRLKILYPETHSLKIYEEEEVYIVKLDLLLSSSASTPVSSAVPSVTEPVEPLPA